MPEILHGSAVSCGRRAVLILGPSGSGKSGLALDLISRGAALVADDRVMLEAAEDGPPRANPPTGLEGRIEARGFGLLRTEWRGGVPVTLAIDLGKACDERLPPARTLALCGHAVPLIWAKDAPNLAAAIFVALKGGLEAHD